MAKKNQNEQPNTEAKKKNKDSFNPLKMSEALQKIGESYSRTEKIIGFLLVFLVAITLGLFFNLPLYLLVIISLVYVALTPKLLYNIKKQRHEKKRFDDANSYLSQMSQSFTSTGNILASLKETYNTYTKGKMKDTLAMAIKKIETSTSDMRQAEIDALGIITKEYDCERVRSLHDFLIKAEVRGGDCVAEFKILEKVRMAWANAALGYRAKLTNSRNLVFLEFGLLIAVCIFFLRRFPESLELISVPAIQVTNAIEIILLFVVYLYTDNKLNRSLLQDVKYLSEEEVEQYQEYLDNFDSKKEIKKNLKLVLIAVVLGGVLIAVNRSPMAIIVAILFILLMFNMHHLQKYLTATRMKSESQLAFPKWLFDIMLLIQSSSVEAAIFSSEELALPVLKPELRKMITALKAQPGDADAYMSFLAGYKIDGVEDTMRKLYSLSVGTGDKEIMQFIIDSNMTSLSEAEMARLDDKGNFTKLYTYLPIICISGALMMYCIMLMVQVFVKLEEMTGILG